LDIDFPLPLKLVFKLSLFWLFAIGGNRDFCILTASFGIINFDQKINLKIFGGLTDENIFAIHLGSSAGRLFGFPFDSSAPTAKRKKGPSC
jgi:hypothetical protein